MPDILIRGMKMPKACKLCKLSSDNHCNATGQWLFSTDLLRSGFNWKTCRLPDCPLHELPEHGDLILKDDAIVAVKLLSDLYPEYRKILAVLWDQIKDLTVIIPESEEVTNDPQP